VPAEEEDIFLDAVSFEVGHRPDPDKFGVEQVTGACQLMQHNRGTWVSSFGKHFCLTKLVNGFTFVVFAHRYPYGHLQLYLPVSWA
jgi:hypothetical protein